MHVRPHAALTAVAALAVMILATSVTARAQGATGGPRRSVTVGLGGGGTIPLGDFADDVKTGWNATGLLQYEPAHSVWGVRGEVQYHRSSYTDAFLSDVGALPEDELHSGVLYAGASALLMGAKREGGITPYLIGGLGLYRLTATITDAGGLSRSRSENGFGFNGGAGIRFGRTTGFFLEARFHQFTITPDGGDSSTSQLIPVSFGILF